MPRLTVNRAGTKAIFSFLAWTNEQREFAAGQLIALIVSNPGKWEVDTSKHGFSRVLSGSDFYERTGKVYAYGKQGLSVKDSRKNREYIYLRRPLQIKPAGDEK